MTNSHLKFSKGHEFHAIHTMCTSLEVATTLMFLQIHVRSVHPPPLSLLDGWLGPLSDFSSFFSLFHKSLAILMYFCVKSLVYNGIKSIIFLLLLTLFVLVLAWQVTTMYSNEVSSCVIKVSKFVQWSR